MRSISTQSTHRSVRQTGTESRRQCRKAMSLQVRRLPLTADNNF